METDKSRNIPDVFSMFFYSFIFILLLVLLNNRKSRLLKISSTFVFITCTVLLFSVIFLSPYFITELEKKNENQYNTAELNYQNIINGIGFIILLFENIISIFSHISFDGNPKITQLKKVFKRSYLVLSYFILIIGVSGYLSIGRI